MLIEYKFSVLITVKAVRPVFKICTPASLIKQLLTCKLRYPVLSKGYSKHD